MGANARSTVGTATDRDDMLRVLFSPAGRAAAGCRMLILRGSHRARVYAGEPVAEDHDPVARSWLLHLTASAPCHINLVGWVFLLAEPPKGM
jgi:hypothetical protein